MQPFNKLGWISVVTSIVFLGFISAIIFKASGILDESAISKEYDNDKTKVTIITSDKILDQSWGSLAYKGQLKIEEQFPVDVELYSEVNTIQLQEETVLNAIDKGAHLIIGHGREFSDVFTSLSLKHPDVHFVTIHGTAENQNQSVYTFNQGKVEFLAGLTAALKTSSNKVALLDAYGVRESVPSFEDGLHYYNPDAEFFYKVVNSRDDGRKAVEIVELLIEDGVDVIYSKGNEFNRDVIEYAKLHDVYVIGYLDDQAYMAKDIVLTSVLNDVSQSYVAIMKDFYSDEGLQPGTRILTEKDEVYQLAPFGPMFSEEELQFMQHELEAYNEKFLY
ncbi:BMP family ABC transporter substrate-binding protein [Halalkalibacter krulwichiae]|uniref:Membrane lipoprotein TmpC n=1 Tax=Halalkalibacter krulwichiae TaxID=199441 RepID=A0A1X9MAW4_9BACI|nr:BMP family ABC transporter substrate-binding protein [Halalkalibacter krulwichiae]ARK30585.1 Membrane lipoprotein TmpC precursor [Halalkalibacter krulwichiae]